MVDLGQVHHLGVDGRRRALQGRALHLVDGPALGAVAAGGAGSAGDVAAAAVEAGDLVRPPPVEPDDAVAVHRDAAALEDGHVQLRGLEDLRHAALGGIVAAHEAHELVVALADARAPQAAVVGVDPDGVAAELDAVVEAGADGLVGLRPLGDDAVPVGVEHGGAPTLGRLGVAGLVPHLGGDPPHRVVHAEVDGRVVLVGEVVVVDGEAVGDLLDRAVPGIVDDGLLGAPRGPEVGQVRVVRPGTAEVRRGVAGVEPRGGPDAPLAVHGDAAQPLGVELDAADLVGRGIEPRQHGVLLVDAVDAPARVQGGVPRVGALRVAARALGGGPVPDRQHDVALEPRRPRRRLGIGAGRDGVGPAAEHRGLRAEPAEHAGHHAAAEQLAVQPLQPRLVGGEVLEVGGYLPRALVAEGVALQARLDGRRDLQRRDVAVGNLQQAEPRGGGIDGGGGPEIGGHGGREVETLPAHPGHPLGVEQAVAAHEDLVAGLGEVGHHVPPLVVGHHDARERRGQVAGLGDHPDPGLGPLRARDHAADVVRVERNGGRLLRSRPWHGGHRYCQPACNTRCQEPHSVTSVPVRKPGERRDPGARAAKGPLSRPSVSAQRGASLRARGLPVLRRPRPFTVPRRITTRRHASSSLIRSWCLIASRRVVTPRRPPA